MLSSWVYDYFYGHMEIWLVVWNMNFISISYMGCHLSQWFLFFKMAIAPPTRKWANVVLFVVFLTAISSPAVVAVVRKCVGHEVDKTFILVQARLVFFNEFNELTTRVDRLRVSLRLVVPQFGIAKLVQRSPISLGFIGVIPILNGDYKPTYNCGGATLYGYGIRMY